MSVEFRVPPPEGEPSFLRPIDRHPRDHSPSATSSRNYRVNPSLVPTNERRVPPPPEPILIPSPAVNARGLSDTFEEHMTLDPDDVEAAYEYHGKKKGFMGGFVSGLRRLPKVMMKRHTPERSPVRQDTGVTPYYNVRPPGRSSGPPNVQFAEEPMEVPPPPPDHGPEVPHERVVSDSTEPGVEDDATTLVHHDMVPPPPPIRPIVSSPDLSEASSYINMPRMQSDASLGAHLARLREVISNLKHMPWMGQSRITLDYFPGEGTQKLQRGRAGPMSWYPPFRPESPLDLLEGASPPPPVLRYSSLAPPHKRASIPESSPTQSDTEHGGPSSPAGFPRPVYPHGYVPYASYQPEAYYPQSTGWGQNQGPPTANSMAQTPWVPGFIFIPSPPNESDPISRPPPVQPA
jgi:hypothetical protein